MNARTKSIFTIFQASSAQHFFLANANLKLQCAKNLMNYWSRMKDEKEEKKVQRVASRAEQSRACGSEKSSEIELSSLFASLSLAHSPNPRKLLNFWWRLKHYFKVSCCTPGKRLKILTNFRKPFFTTFKNEKKTNSNEIPRLKFLIINNERVCLVLFIAFTIAWTLYVIAMLPPCYLIVNLLLPTSTVEHASSLERKAWKEFFKKRKQRSSDSSSCLVLS